VKSHLAQTTFWRKIGSCSPADLENPKCQTLAEKSGAVRTSLDHMKTQGVLLDFAPLQKAAKPGLILGPPTTFAAPKKVSFSLGGRKITFPGESGFFIIPQKP
jgi:hypothetical protein